jgi:hypothetical protein
MKGRFCRRTRIDSAGSTRRCLESSTVCRPESAHAGGSWRHLIQAGFPSRVHAFSFRPIAPLRRPER